MDTGCDWYYTGYRKIASTKFILYRKLLLFLCIDLNNRNTHTQKYLDCSILEAASTTYDASLFSLRKVSLSLFLLGILVMCKLGHLEHTSLERVKLGSACARSKSRHVHCWLKIKYGDSDELGAPTSIISGQILTVSTTPTWFGGPISYIDTL